MSVLALTIAAGIASYFVTRCHSAQPNVILFVLDDFDYTTSMTESLPETTSDDFLDVNTTWINKIRNEGFIFPLTYAGGPKSGPSRYSLLTGRYPSRAKFAQYRTNRAATPYDGEDGTYIDTATMVLNGTYDSTFNIPNILRDEATYTTGLVGLYGILYNSENFCGDLSSAITDTSGMGTSYSACVTKMEKYGWDYVDGLYVETIDETNGVFSHNPEWMVDRAIEFMDDAVNNQAKPFFLYFGSTLTSSPDAFDAMFKYDISATPAGILTGSNIPDSTVMKSRNDTYDMTVADGWKNNRLLTVRGLFFIFVNFLCTCDFFCFFAFFWRCLR